MKRNLDEPSFSPKQREVQRRLGRCLMRLQQVELIAKALWHGHEKVGCLDDLPDGHSNRKDSISGKTLGAAINKLAGSFLRADLGSDDGVEAELAIPQTDAKRIAIGYRVTMSMSKEDYQKAVLDLEALVELRNELVHKFIQRIDFWSEEGCEAAICYLDDCDAIIGVQLAQMQSWFSSWRGVTECLAAFSQTEDFFGLLNQGRTPDGKIDWRSAPVVQALREAESKLSDEGWTKLPDAIAWIAKEYPHETPAGYGCARWRHLLHESELFEIRRLGIPGDDAEIATVFRSRPPA
jgi:hypothetical protein